MADSRGGLLTASQVDKINEIITELAGANAAADKALSVAE